jgi:hypothetical protein
MELSLLDAVTAIMRMHCVQAQWGGRRVDCKCAWLPTTLEDAIAGLGPLPDLHHLPWVVQCVHLPFCVICLLHFSQEDYSEYWGHYAMLPIIVLFIFVSYGLVSITADLQICGINI